LCCAAVHWLFFLNGGMMALGQHAGSCCHPGMPLVICSQCFYLILDYACRLQIHWFSIFNSFMMVMFLTGLVAIILMRTLRKDYAR
jgi:hypothetical protein